MLPYTERSSALAASSPPFAICSAAGALGALGVVGEVVGTDLDHILTYRLVILDSLAVCVTIDLLHDLSGHLFQSVLDAAGQKCFSRCPWPQLMVD